MTLWGQTSGWYCVHS